MRFDTRLLPEVSIFINVTFCFVWGKFGVRFVELSHHDIIIMLEFWWCVWCFMLMMLFLSAGSASTLLHHARQPPPLSLPSSGQAIRLPFLFLPPSRPLDPSSLSQISADPALPLLVLLSAPPLRPPLSSLRVPPGWRSCHRARRRSPRGTRRSEGWHQPERGRITPSLPSWLAPHSPHQPQTDQLAQHRCHLGGQL